jgi:hypothetical protein
MAKTKKLDVFNLFYSGAAVIILLGVIAKLLEWPMQDFLITFGLAIEAVVFGVTAIKFVEVKKDTEVATEATLAKVADGLGAIKSTANSFGGNHSTDTNISISGVDYNDSTNDFKAGNADVKININSSGSEFVRNASHSLWQLEQMDILTLAKDLFFQPAWDRLTADEYIIVSDIFKRVFDKKLPNKEALPFLIEFPVKLPIPDISKLTLDKSHQLQQNEVEVLCKSFKLIKSTYLFDQFIFEQTQDLCELRPKNAREVQIFGGEDEKVLTYISKFYKKELIVGPSIDCLSDTIKLKGTQLTEYFVEKIDIKNDNQLASLTEILVPSSDLLKMKLLQRFKKIRYDIESNSGYSTIKTIIQLILTFRDRSGAVQVLKQILEIYFEKEKYIILDDVVNYQSDIIYFGSKNEYSVNVNELFLNNELKNIEYVNVLIEKLTQDNVSIKQHLFEVFDLRDQNSKKEVFEKLNYHLNKSNVQPSGAQLAFILLYKQYS